MSVGTGTSGGGPPREEIPPKIGRYDIERVLGEGGQGRVFLAHDPVLDRQVAIKELKGSGDANERFTRDARALARLRSPHIVEIFDINPDWPYFVMEYCGDGDLDERIKSRRPMSLSAVVRLTRQICDALIVAHDHGTLHRDLKPGNVLFVGDTPKVTDFGLAKVLGDTTTGLTMTNAPMGTIGYCSPEQIERPTEVDFRTDLWAVGVILYELLTFRSPFEQPGDQLYNTMRRVMSRPPLDPPYEVPAPFWGIVQRALEKDPEQRFASARELSDALRGALAQVKDADSISVPPDDTLDEIDVLARRVAHSLSSGSAEEAREWLRQMYDASPDHSLWAFWDRKVRNLSRTSMPSQPAVPTLDSGLALIEEMLGKYQFEDAVKECGKLLGENPTDTRILDLLGRVKSQERSLAESLTRARAAADTESPERIIETWAEVDAAFPNHPTIIAELAAARHVVQRAQQAQQWKQLEQQVNELRASGRLEDARDMVEGWIRQHPPDAGASGLLESLKQQIEQKSAAERLAGLLAGAQRSRTQGDLQQALELARQALAIAPTDERAHRLAEDVRLEIVSRRRQDRVAAVRTAAESLERSGNFEEAIARWNEFLIDYPTDEEGKAEAERLARTRDEREKAQSRARAERAAAKLQQRVSAGRYDSIPGSASTAREALVAGKIALDGDDAGALRRAAERLEQARKAAEAELNVALRARRAALNERITEALDVLAARADSPADAEVEQELESSVKAVEAAIVSVAPQDAPGDPVAALVAPAEKLESALERVARRNAEQVEQARGRAGEALAAAEAAVSALAKTRHERVAALAERLGELQTRLDARSVGRLEAVAGESLAVRTEAESLAVSFGFGLDRELRRLLQEAVTVLGGGGAGGGLAERVLAAAALLERDAPVERRIEELAQAQDALQAALDAARGAGEETRRKLEARWSRALEAWNTAGSGAVPEALDSEAATIREAGGAALQASRFEMLATAAGQLEGLAKRCRLERAWREHRSAVRGVEGPGDSDGIARSSPGAEAEKLLARYRQLVARGSVDELEPLRAALAAQREDRGDGDEQLPDVPAVPSRQRSLNRKLRPAALDRFDRAAEAYDRALEGRDRTGAAELGSDLKRCHDVLLRPGPLWPLALAASAALLLIAIGVFLAMPKPQRTEVRMVSTLGTVAIRSVTRDGSPVSGLPSELSIDAAGRVVTLEPGSYVATTEHGVEVPFEAPSEGTVFIPGKPQDYRSELIKELDLDDLLADEP